jgi:hypothetical protein
MHQGHRFLLCQTITTFVTKLLDAGHTNSLTVQIMFYSLDFAASPTKNIFEEIFISAPIALNG